MPASTAVLEVDFTTDVRRGKLGLYEEWGFPEVWVEVPDRYSPSRPARRRPGVTIHLLEEGAYRTAPESRAFAGWTAEEIHAALNEPTVSEDTVRILKRVGRTLGAREGTGPDDMPWLRVHREEGRAEGKAEGRAEVLDVLRRKITLSREVSGVSDAEILDALRESEDLADLLARLERPRR